MQDWAALPGNPGARLFWQASVFGSECLHQTIVGLGHAHSKPCRSQVSDEVDGPACIHALPPIHLPGRAPAPFVCHCVDLGFRLCLPCSVDVDVEYLPTWPN
jgi:hypothetical protein